MSTDTDRDRSIDHLLRRTMAERVNAGPSPQCLDAETLAAWLDGGLSESERVSAEAHASDCVHCQAALAALARAAAPPERPAVWWRRPWHLGWMVPLAAGAAAVALWVAVPDRPTPQAPATRPPAVVDRSSLDVAKPPEVSRQAPDATAAALEKQKLVSPAPVRQNAQEKELADKKTERDERRVAEPSSSLAAAAATKAATTSSPAADQVAAAPPPAATAPRPSAAQAEVAEPVARARSAEAGTQNESALARPLQSYRETVSLDRSTRWRVGSAGVVQRSTDGGSTWESLATGVTSELLAVSSPSSVVCWVVGRAGTVLRAVDGRRFVRLTPPVAADLMAVRATDDRAASVTTADGRTFRTENGGTTWTEVR